MNPALSFLHSNRDCLPVFFLVLGTMVLTYMRWY